MSPDTRLRLSPEGEARRESMLGGLLQEMRGLHRARRRRRRVVAATGGAMLIVLAAIGAWRGLERPAATLQPRRLVEAPARGDTPAPIADVQHVATDPDILARFRPAATFMAEHLDDDALLAALSELRRPTGLIRIGGKARLTAAVADNDHGNDNTL